MILLVATEFLGPFLPQVMFTDNQERLYQGTILFSCCHYFIKFIKWSYWKK